MSLTVNSTVPEPSLPQIGAPLLPSIVILDDDDEMRSILLSQTRSQDYHLLEAKSFTEALKHVQNTSVSLLLTTLRIPEITLPEFLKRARFLKPSNMMSVLVLMNPAGNRDTEFATSAGADDVLVRPFERNGLNLKIRNLLKRIHPTLGASANQSNRLTYKELVLDLKSYDVFL